MTNQTNTTTEQKPSDDTSARPRTIVEEMLRLEVGDEKLAEMGFTNETPEHIVKIACSESGVTEECRCTVKELFSRYGLSIPRLMTSCGHIVMCIARMDKQSMSFASTEVKIADHATKADALKDLLLNCLDLEWFKDTHKAKEVEAKPSEARPMFNRSEPTCRPDVSSLESMDELKKLSELGFTPKVIEDLGESVGKILSGPITFTTDAGREVFQRYNLSTPTLRKVLGNAVLTISMHADRVDNSPQVGVVLVEYPTHAHAVATLLVQAMNLGFMHTPFSKMADRQPIMNMLRVIDDCGYLAQSTAVLCGLLTKTIQDDLWKDVLSVASLNVTEVLVEPWTQHLPEETKAKFVNIIQFCQCLVYIKKLEVDRR